MAAKSAVSPADALKAGTAVVAAVAAAIAWLKENPEVWEKVKGAAEKVLRQRAASVAGVRELLADVQEQIDYLIESADDDGESQRAQAWSKTANKLDHAAALLGKDPSAKDVKALLKRARSLRDEVLAAFITESAEDAQKVFKAR